ncbi:MAG: hypothetical protein A3E79_13820 [Burkholderiales bacterium RIFCSPHIGHO2_12_FULL_61_11]|nr:MAG: hypothetical protein A3E79_13820 [Burkholderiales bacterium RIFCSPHIGHO2_12_FULL_61_11]
MNHKKHFTTRRAFIAASGFGGVSLYGLWAAYGAAPGPLALLGLDGAHDEALAPDTAQPHGAPAAGGGHGAAAAGPDSKEFSRMTAEFSERYRMPDGSVYPRRLAAVPNGQDDPHAAMQGMPADPHAGPDMQNMSLPADPHASMQGMQGMPTDQPAAHAEHGEAAIATAGKPLIDVLMMAGRWYYLPNVLRLDVGQPYRFRMMALDVTHGASIQFGKGGRMMRLQPGRLTETELTFQQAGSYLMNCTVYCGAAHDMMQATIKVA